MKPTVDRVKAVVEFFHKSTAPVDTLTQEEREVVREACTVLEPFEQVTVEISTESYVIASKLLLLSKCLQRIAARHQREETATTGQVTKLVDTLCIYGTKVPQTSIQSCCLRNHNT
ncbi:hypothetical protein AAFF_G00007890 [Aldrovandia affinis]|uniref:Uncharacterized protein n=1 Tax=Aldrovandia affinis TaxID=143900 RepID=A0AAD7WZ57_9TELE|nr:hypothetical protein AAFF_G00007890 [Aldrovandia affinis]